ncbi:hypothetical protein [Endozoicomonas ascidiicola]|uniref:hypothetical protein n=1 Tax=Endozoicomonas ascidiicola TaxID=1698521 RepID=UPI000830A95E|nr:hypothetical protein [Endozoicomonas ascidiicola]
MSATNSQKTLDIARKYQLVDIPQASQIATRLHIVLDSLEKGKTIPEFALSCLEDENLHALRKLTRNELSFSAYEKMAKAEITARQSAKGKELKQVQAELKTLKEEEAAEAKKAEAVRRAEAKKAEAARRAYENDPRTIARQKARAELLALREKYSPGFFIDQDDYHRLMIIWRHVDQGKRLSEVDLAWLSTNEEYFSQELRRKYHANEAKYYEADFKQTRNPWSAVNACSQYRKAEMASSGDRLLSTLNLSSVKNAKLKSALLTTHGGAKRDQRLTKEAIRMGEEAHQVTPQNFRPCTLLGAIYMEMGQLSLGHEWYQKAIERGFSERAMDSELKSIFMKADKAGREKLKAFLLKEDHVRFAWVHKLSSTSKKLGKLSKSA